MKSEETDALDLETEVKLVEELVVERERYRPRFRFRMTRLGDKEGVGMGNWSVEFRWQGGSASGNGPTIYEAMEQATERIIGWLRENPGE